MLNNLLVFLVFLVLSIFSSCTKNQPWEFSSIRSENPEYDFAKISHLPSNELDGINLEIVRTGNKIQGYLSVANFEIPSYKENRELAKVTLICQGEEHSFIITRLQGGQKLKLSKECLEFLLARLKISPLTIKTGHFSQTIEAGLFESYYQKLEKKSFQFLPENLITFEVY